MACVMPVGYTTNSYGILYRDLLIQAPRAALRRHYRGMRLPEQPSSAGRRPGLSSATTACQDSRRPRGTLDIWLATTSQ